MSQQSGRLGSSMAIASFGLLLLLFAPLALALRRWRRVQVQRTSAARRQRLISRPDVELIVRQMEQLVQRDEGKRGIADIALPPGELCAAATALCASQRVAVLTGFPCCIDNTPPTETDGPLGALAVARALLLMGKESVTMLTDECNAEVLLACASGTDFTDCDRSRLKMESFPPMADGSFDVTDQERLAAIGADVDCIVAVERTGLNAKGKYLTMSGKDMSLLVAPLDMLMLSAADEDVDYPDDSSGGKIKTIAIGKSDSLMLSVLSLVSRIEIILVSDANCV